MDGSEVINLRDRMHLKWEETPKGFRSGKWVIWNCGPYPRLFYDGTFHINGDLERLFNYAYQNERRQNAKEKSPRPRSS